MNPKVVHSMKADQAIDLAGRLETQEDIDAVREEEANHPDYDGGRKTVLEALEAREEELAEAAQLYDSRTVFEDEVDGGREYFYCLEEGCRFGAFQEARIRAHVRAPHP